MKEKSLDTLVEDIYEIFKGDTTGITEEKAKRFSDSLSQTIVDRLVNGQRVPALSMSNLGKPDRQLWYTINRPDLAEEIPPKTRMNFLLGDIIEEVVLFLADCAGHKIEGRQDTLEVNGVKGHRDAVIDGVVVDVKSANSRSYTKFVQDRISEDDPFGYIDQLNLYLAASDNDPHVEHHDKAAFVAVNKEVGGIHVNWQKRKGTDYNKLAEHKKEMLKRQQPPSEKCYDPVPDGKSGNMKLNVNCSYCSFKWDCHKNLRGFHYSNGPRFLTKVVRQPDVPEIRRGKVFYSQEEINNTYGEEDF